VCPESTVAQKRLVAALLDPARSPLGGDHVTLIETHISYVLLTGHFAYKIKKSVNLGFLDFRTLAARRFYCQEELRLNRRLAPALYLDVVAITGSSDAPTLGGDAAAIEYAVKMREFPQDALASHALSCGQLSHAHIDALATQVAAFHRTTARATAESAFGTPQAVLALALRNVTELSPLLEAKEDLADLGALADWIRAKHGGCNEAMTRRRAQGFIRECHGDLHLGNIALLHDQPVVFDCIEFNEHMRWIDVISEVAFTMMDLQSRGRIDLAYRYLNTYLEASGDYDGLGVLGFYLVYRAMVRAKVACLRARQFGAGAAAATLIAEYHHNIQLAQTYARPTRPAIVITHGFAGSGKTTLSQTLLERVGAVRVRTDIERKRLHGMQPTDRSDPAIASGLYAAGATEETYRRALSLTQAAVAAGFMVIVDGAFLQLWQRQLFRNLATERRISLVIVDLVASEVTLRQRIVRRLRAATDASDADLAVLAHQRQIEEPLELRERADTVVYDADTPCDEAQSTPAWHAILDRLADQRTLA
jgi:uncharacterized protein